MIKKELDVYLRVPGSSDQNTGLDITLDKAQLKLFFQQLQYTVKYSMIHCSFLSHESYRIDFTVYSSGTKAIYL